MKNNLYFAHVVDDMVIEIKKTSQELIDQQEDKNNWIQVFLNVLKGYFIIEEENKEPVFTQDISNKNILEIKNTPHIGYYYDSNLKFFYPKQPHLSWVLNLETGTWDSPEPRPETNPSNYEWNEKHSKWMLVKRGF